jgi:hypothetical protein
MALENDVIFRALWTKSSPRGDIEAAARYASEDVIEQIPLPGQVWGLTV